jgi:3-deoxy-D-manno-octulosonic-acid transferase
LVPRVPDRAIEISLSYKKRSEAALPGASDAVYLCDTFGELGLWYRLAKVTFVGGSFGAVEGHNPWEPAALGSAVLHGPRVANFAADYEALHQAHAALAVTEVSLPEALVSPDITDMSYRAGKLVDASRGALLPLAADLIRLVRYG